MMSGLPRWSGSSPPRSTHGSRGSRGLWLSLLLLILLESASRTESFFLGRLRRLSTTAIGRRPRGPRLSAESGTPSTHFDFLVIGAGSGGIASARRAASFGAKVAVVEKQALGGTCVNVGCVPKKVMWNAAHVQEVIHGAKHFGFSVGEVGFDWAVLKKARDDYVKRLNGIYGNNLGNSQVELLQGEAQFTGPKAVKVAGKEYTADHILIAVGGKPSMPSIAGIEHAIDSDGFFRLDKLPSRVAVVGAGYIAVELAGMLQQLGSDTSLFVRGDSPLRNFDDLIRTTLVSEMVKSGLKLVTGFSPKALAKDPVSGKLTIESDKGAKESDFDVVIMATGRVPNIDSLSLDKAGVKITDKGFIEVDEYQNTNVKGVYSVGDVCGKVQLTPMAIAAGRRLADRLFGSIPNAKADYDSVPTVVFSHPAIGTVGLTEAEARKKYGDDKVKVYTSRFVNLYYGPWRIDPDAKPKTAMKLVCTGQDEQVVGLHVIGEGADEMLQGFAVAVKMKATKENFDSCVALHPTASEEFVTMAPWGLSGGKR